MAKSSSFGQLAGLLIISVLILAGTGLFGVWSAHHRGAEALKEANQLTTLADTAREAQVDFKIQVQYWKNFLLRGQNADDFQSYRMKLQEQQKKVQARLAALLNTPGLSGPLQTEITSIQHDHAQLGEAYHQAALNYVVGEPASIFRVDASVRGIDQKLNDRFDQVAAALDQARNERVLVLRSDNEMQYERLRLVASIVSALAVVIVVVVGFMTMRLGA